MCSLKNSLCLRDINVLRNVCLQNTQEAPTIKRVDAPRGPKYDYRLPRGPSCMTTLPSEGVAVLVTPLTTGYAHISLRCVAALLRQAAKKGKYDDVFSLLEEHKSIRIDAVRLGGSGKTALYIAAERGYLHVRLLTVVCHTWLICRPCRLSRN